MMISFFLFTFISVLTFTATNANSTNQVIKLTDSNFEHTTQASTGQTTGKWFVNFHSPACKHCQTLAPTWAALSKKLQKQHEVSGILIGSVNVKENPILAERFAIQGLPTLIYFAEGSMFVYPPEGERLIDEFISFVFDDGSGEGGYKQMVERKSVPKGPEGFVKLVGDLRKYVHDIELLKFLLDDVEHILILRKNAAVLLLLSGFFIGFFVASLLGLNKRNPSVAKVEMSSDKKNE